MKKFLMSVYCHPFVVCLVSAPILNLIIEMFSRTSFVEGFKHVYTNPLIFLYNSLLILFTLSIALLFKRKIFFIQLISLLWLALGITNGIVCMFRITPVSAIDFFVFGIDPSIVIHYLTYWQMGLIALGIAAVIALEVFICIKDQKVQMKTGISLIIIASLIVLTGAATIFGRNSGFLSNKDEDLIYAYDDYGFVYCFSTSIFDTGISRPKDYSEESVNKVLAKLPADKSDAAEVHPDIIMLQIESFMDLKYIDGLELSENPSEIFEKLKDENPSGLLSVGAIGNGTSNTEFEMLTGIDISLFGPGEYPNMTVLSRRTCEALPNVLRPLGYTSHAIHNNTGIFYDRDGVFAKLGFDTFTPIEYMSDVEYNPFNWAKDKMLLPAIKEALDAKGDNKFIYAIGVQGHGGYPKEKVECKYDIQASGINEKYKTQIEYYANQLKEIDDFIGELVFELQQYDRPIMLIIFGDHLPPIEVEDIPVKDITLYQTEYVIWSNFGLTGEDADLEAYQLPSHALELIGYNCGMTTKINQLGENNPNYSEDLRMIAYDMLYGKNYAHGMKAISATKLQFGVNPPKITNAYVKDGNLYVEGENFTEFSRIDLNGKNKKTQYVSSTLLMVEKCIADPGDKLCIEQACPSGKVLGKSETKDY